jgi:tRNA(fMet)-specific endonuclease VapC
MVYLLDTDTFILLIRGTALTKVKTTREIFVKNAAQKILARAKKATSAGDMIGLSAISLAELEYGARHSGHHEKHHAALRKTLSPFHAFAFDAVDCVHHYGIVRAALEAKGLGIGPLDTLIAAHSMALGAVLVTHNTKEFSRISQLQIKDWSV